MARSRHHPVCLGVLTSFLCGLLAVGVGHAQEPLAPGASLPATDTPLRHVDGRTVTLKQLTGATGTVLLFWSNRCPWVDKYEGRIQDLVAEFGDAGIRFVRINANDDADWPSESLGASKTRADRRDYAAPYVRDPAASLARTLGATRTPHAFVFDGEGTLVYVGAVDDSPGDPGRVSSAYLRNALRALVNDAAPPVSKTKAFGCTLKYPDAE
jgi:thiol-disulfide isomerase/thioredoxin